MIQYSPSLALESLCGWGVPTEYLVAPVLNWTGLGCDKIHTSWRSESSNVSLVVLDKLIFVKKKESIIDGAVKVESLLIIDNMSSKVVSFFKESSRLKRLHIDGTYFITNCKG